MFPKLTKQWYDVHEETKPIEETKTQQRERERQEWEKIKKKKAERSLEMKREVQWGFFYFPFICLCGAGRVPVGKKLLSPQPTPIQPESTKNTSKKAWVEVDLRVRRVFPRPTRDGISNWFGKSCSSNLGEKFGRPTRNTIEHLRLDNLKG